MTKTKFRKEFQKLTAMKRVADENFDKLNAITGHNIGEAPLHESYYLLFDYAVDLLERQIDGDGWISWFIFDAGRPAVARIGKKSYKINTAGQLYDFIQAYNKETK